MTGSVTRNKHTQWTATSLWSPQTYLYLRNKSELRGTGTTKLMCDVLLPSQVQTRVTIKQQNCCMTSIDNKIHYGNICKGWKNTRDFTFKLSFHYPLHYPKHRTPRSSVILDFQSRNHFHVWKMLQSAGLCLTVPDVLGEAPGLTEPVLL